MKRDTLYIPFVLTGSAIGYYLGNKGGSSGWALFSEILIGSLLFYSFAFAFLEKQYGIFIGAIISVLGSLSLDWVAGSEIDTRNKLSFIFLGSFVGWGFSIYWKATLIGGLIGGAFGFIWGLTHSHWFGQVCLPPSFFNASLSAVQIFILGMGLSSFYMKLLGWRFLVNRTQAQ